MEIAITEQNRTIENAIELVIIQRIHEIRGKRVMLDFDLAEIYQVPTKRLKEQVRRNIERFPDDFMFQLLDEEWNILVANCDQLALTSIFENANSFFPKSLREAPI